MRPASPAHAGIEISQRYGHAVPKNWFSGVKLSLPFAMSCVLSMYLIAGETFECMEAIPRTRTCKNQDITAGMNNSQRFEPASVTIPIAEPRQPGAARPNALTAPLGLGLIYTLLFDSSIRITRGKGVTWKDVAFMRAAVFVPHDFAGRFAGSLKE